jgi:CheY-like chemotaxis protein
MMLETITRGSPRSPAGKSLEARQPAISLHVESAEDGENGWEKLRSGYFDLALVDIHLPGGTRLAAPPPLTRAYVRSGTRSALTSALTSAGLRPSGVRMVCARAASGVDLAWCYQQIHAESLSRSAQEPHTSCSKQTIIIACTADTNVDRDQLERCGMHDVRRAPAAALRPPSTITTWPATYLATERHRAPPTACSPQCATAAHSSDLHLTLHLTSTDGACVASGRC